MPKIWPLEVMRELLALAAATGESRAELATEEEAKLFRFAIYNFRKTNDLGADLSITTEANVVIVRKRLAPKITIACHASPYTDL